MIEFLSVHKQYEKQIGEKHAHVALRGISFELKQGQTLGMVGPNGAGKSTSIRLMMDFIRPTEGEIRILDKAPGDPAIRKQIGYLPETASFPKNLTCMEMATFAGITCGMNKKAIAEQSEKWLSRLGLWEHRNRLIRSFSKGMQQRMGFAMALLHDPELLILDEPMSGLDPLGRAEIVALTEGLRSEGKSILFCSHILTDVERLTDEVLILHKGKVCFHGGLEQIHQQTGETNLETAFLNVIEGQGR